jgi:hypothetical protein
VTVRLLCKALISEEARERGVEPEDVAQLLRDKVIEKAMKR